MNLDVLHHLRRLLSGAVWRPPDTSEEEKVNRLDTAIPPNGGLESLYGCHIELSVRNILSSTIPRAHRTPSKFPGYLKQLAVAFLQVPLFTKVERYSLKARVLAIAEGESSFLQYRSDAYAKRYVKVKW